MATVAIVTPTIPPRKHLLAKAMESVENQTRQPDLVVVESDPFKTGAARTRNRAMVRVDTDYIAPLDDDDTLLENHLEVLMGAAEANPEMDVIYPIPLIEGMRDPTAVVVDGKWRLPWGLEWTEDHRQHMIWRGNFIPHTCLIKVKTFLRVGGYPEPGDSDDKLSPCDDWKMLRRIALKGGKFLHVPEVTWRWAPNPDGHTGGEPHRW